ncbi:hypothetical protein EJ06DRAFT_104223 [Trichodelitschia bisporula]|uniref:Uncharacterized protein n=1 Tax=Trichodelitschia bisporula TaxID=703511 RepID=A0A6G1HR71_9PEZI|nr:hypothetical protein EJ06DRAFT_104223 [Trichodelitschia bisporula]
MLMLSAPNDRPSSIPQSIRTMAPCPRRSGFSNRVHVRTTPLCAANASKFPRHLTCPSYFPQQIRSSTATATFDIARISPYATRTRLFLGNRPTTVRTISGIYSPNPGLHKKLGQPRVFLAVYIRTRQDIRYRWMDRGLCNIGSLMWERGIECPS